MRIERATNGGLMGIIMIMSREAERELAERKKGKEGKSQRKENVRTENRDTSGTRHKMWMLM